MNKLGKFEIIAKIGQGAMGVVYKARDPFIDRIVALKTLTTSLSGDPHHLKRFYSEARSAGNLRHPNIVTIYELGHEGDTPFIAMQFLHGESLDKIIDRLPNLPLSQKIGFIVYVCRALEYAHTQTPPVIHRDIKPGNVMIAPDGSVVVVDFGIARLGESTVSQSGGLLIGTLGYMAPQLFRGTTADARSDIWATGVMFYELLAYRRPFKGENAAAMMSNIILEEPRSILEAAPGTPEDVRDILDRMLAKDVEARYQSMEEVLMELEPVWKRLLQSDISVLLENSQRLYRDGDLMAAKSEIVQILVWDPSNTQAKGLSEKISAEVRRQQIVPQLKSLVENAQKLLAEGRNEQAKAEAEAALKLDSSFQLAREIVSQARAALERTREIDLAIRASKQRMAEGALTEAETQVGKALALDPGNTAARDQLKQVQDERSSRERRKRHAALLDRARSFWTNLQYEDCINLLVSAQQQFPGDPEILKLLDTARHDQAEQRRQALLGEVRHHLGAQQFEAALKGLDALLEQFPSDATARNLRTQAQRGRDQQQREQRLKEKQDLFKQRVREVERMIERQQLTEAIDLARQTITTIGADPRLADTLLKAERELEFREQKKRQQNETVQMARILLDEGKLDDAMSLVKEALETRLFPDNDSRIKKLLEEIDAKKQPQPTPIPSARSSPTATTFRDVFSSGSKGDPAKDYVYMRGTPVPEAPAHAEQNAATPTAGASAPGVGGRPIESPSSPPSESGIPTPTLPFSRSEVEQEPLVQSVTSSLSVPEATKPATVEQSKRVMGLGWQEEERQFLTAVEKHLATFLGPVASIIARRAASKAKDPEELFALLASTLQAETDRQAFLARKNELLHGLRPIQTMRESSPTEGPAGNAVQPLVAGSAAAELTPAAVRHASELLARHLGPVSRVLTERAAHRVDSLRALYFILAAHLEDRAERARFLQEAGFPESPPDK
jgi:serine/threonine protein kinase